MGRHKPGGSAGGAHHLADGVNCEKSYARPRHLGHRAFDGFGDVVELEIEENIFALRQKLAHKLHACRGIKLHADLVEVGLRAEARHQAARFFGGFHVEGYDDAILGHIGLKLSSL